MFCCIHRCLLIHTDTDTHCIRGSFQFVILLKLPLVFEIHFLIFLLLLPSLFLHFLLPLPPPCPPPILPPLFPAPPRRQAPGVTSKLSTGDSVLSLKSLCNHPCSLFLLSRLLSPLRLPPPRPLTAVCQEKYRRLLYLFPPLFPPPPLASLSPSSHLPLCFTRSPIFHFFFLNFTPLMLLFHFPPPLPFLVCGLPSEHGMYM